MPLPRLASLRPIPMLPHCGGRLGITIALALLGAFTSACRPDDRIAPDERRAIADTLTALVTEAYDLQRPDAPARLLALYPDSGRVISAVAGRVTTTRDALATEIRGFWERVGQNMRDPQFVLGSTYVDVITRDAAVVTLTYRIPHRTPRDTPHVVGGAWTMLWRRQAGRWHIVQEHLSDAPAGDVPAGDAPTGDGLPIDSMGPAHGH